MAEIIIALAVTVNSFVLITGIRLKESMHT